MVAPPNQLAPTLLETPVSTMFRAKAVVKTTFGFVLLLSFASVVIFYFKAAKNVSYPKNHITDFAPKNCSSLSKHQLLLFVGIHSAPSRIDRRNAIRETWMKDCQSNVHAVCRFFTDGQDHNGKNIEGDERTRLENETRVQGDILLAEVPGGVNFALKYLWMLQWADRRYKFRYFLRLDDDYFICFHKLMLELACFRPTEKFQWGWLHCDLKGMIIFGNVEILLYSLGSDRIFITTFLCCYLNCNGCVPIEMCYRPYNADCRVYIKYQDTMLNFLPMTLYSFAESI